MDRDTVRLFLLIVGGLVIAGIYLHGRFGHRIRTLLRTPAGLGALPADWSDVSGKSRHDDLDHERAAEDSAICDFSEDDENSEGYGLDSVREPRRPDTDAPRENSIGAPFLIQASVVARHGETFSGEELRDALLDLGLVHGEMDIFHRYDRNFREPLFSVASLVKPGTFPMDSMEEFDCPGVVFFFQPSKVPDPLAVFDDLFETSRDLAEKLDGLEWDEHRQPLTEESVRVLRDRVALACE